MHHESGADSPAVVSAIEIQPPRDVVGDRVAILISDIEGSTEMAQTLDTSWQDVLSGHHRLVRRCCTAREGFEASNNGDGFLYLFSSVTAAVAAAVAARDSLRHEVWPTGTAVRVRIAVHVGSVVHRPDAGFIGVDIHRAARIMSAGHGDQILLSAAAYACLDPRAPAPVGHVIDHGFYWLKDLRSPERIYELTDGGLGGSIRARSVGQADYPATPCRLVGREEELHLLQRLLVDRRGVPITVCGAGGVGKTRLAIELLRSNQTRPGTFIDLAPMMDSTQVLTELARVLGIDGSTTPTIDDVAWELDRRATLIVLDNVEQVIGAAPMIARLARLASEARLVVTSRMNLNVTGEAVIALAPLTVGGGTSTALELFEELAVELHGRALTTPEERRVAAEICSLLDGLPLAIELAVGRLDMLGLGGLRRHLSQSTQILVAGRRDASDRHRALESAVRWSYDLLGARAQRVFRCLSQLPGGATAGSIVELAGFDLSSALVSLEELVDHRLAYVNPGSAGEPRFVMLRVVRDFGTHELECDEAAQLWAGITVHSQRLARRAEVELSSHAVHDSYLELLDEIDNVRSVLERGVGDDILLERALALAADMTPFWWQDHLAEGLQWLRRLAAAGDSTPTAPRAYVRAAMLATYGGRADDAIQLAQRGVELCRAQARQGSDLSLGLQVLAAAWSAQGERARALAAVEEGLTIDRTVRPGTRAIHVVNHGNVLLAENLIDEAEALYAESQAFFERQGDSWLIAGPLARLGDVAIRRGDLDRAAELLARALTTWRQGGASSGQARAQAGLARARFLAGDRDDAVRLAGAAFTWAREAGTHGEAPWAIAVRAATLVTEARPEDAGLLFGAAHGLGVAFAQPLHGCIAHDLGAANAELDEMLTPAGAEQLRRQGRSWSVDRAMVEVAARWT
jgi:predicted ATPase/class 3 adenylate cyclase